MLKTSAISFGGARVDSVSSPVSRFESNVTELGLVEGDVPDGNVTVAGVLQQPALDVPQIEAFVEHLSCQI